MSGRVVLRSLTAAVLLVGASARAAPIPTPTDDSRPRTLDETARAINEHFTRYWKDNNLKPAEKTDDHAFLRRVTLDLVGRVATVEEAREFVRDPRGDKRLRVVDRLLESAEFADYWSEVWSDWLVPQRIDAKSREQLRTWLRGELARNRSYREVVEKLLGATGKPGENGAVVFTLAHLGRSLPKKDAEQDGQHDCFPLTDRVGKLFLATDLHCVRCHDHAFNAEGRQKHFWGINGFLRQIEVRQKGGEVELADNPAFNKTGIVHQMKRNGVVTTVRPTFLDGTRMKADEKRPRRAVLAEMVTTFPRFNEAVVHRAWGHFFGRGLTESGEDEFGDHNPIAHPELMGRLCKDFVAGGHDLKKLLRWISTSDAYQLRIGPPPKEDQQAATFHQMQARPLDLKRRLRSMRAVLRASETLTAAEWKKLSDGWAALAPEPPGTCEDHLACTREGPAKSAASAPRFESYHFLLASSELQTALAHAKGTPARAAAQPRPASVLDELYLAAYNRPPTTGETERMHKSLKEMKADKLDAAVCQDLLWALLASSEFATQR